MHRGPLFILPVFLWALIPTRLGLAEEPALDDALTIADEEESTTRPEHRLGARKIDRFRADGHLNVGYRGTVGIGFRVDIPVFQNGWLDHPDITDEFAISAGADLMFADVNGRDLDLGFWPTVAAQWNLYVGEEWSFLTELGVALLIGDDHYHADGPDTVDVTFVASFGLRWHFTLRNALLVRITHPAGVQVGVTF